MGLTIHYQLRCVGALAHVTRKLAALRQAALDLPLAEVQEIVHLQGDRCRPEHYEFNSALRWLAIQAGLHLPCKEKPRFRGERGRSYSLLVDPLEIVAFTVLPGDGCENLELGLARYPATITHEGRAVPTKLAHGWHWRAFCKTQYASDPACGGVPNFLRCHLGITALLDRAQALGILKSVTDEGHFWESRSIEALTKEIGSWNAMIAVLGGALKDAVGDDVQVAAPIFGFANFEALEAAGHASLPDAVKRLAAAVRAVQNTAGSLPE